MKLLEKYPDAYEDEKGTIWVSREFAENADWTYKHGDAFLENILGWDWMDAEENFVSCQLREKRRAFWKKHPILRVTLRFIVRWYRTLVMTWKMWSIFPHGDHPYDNISLSTAFDVSRRLWLR